MRSAAGDRDSRTIITGRISSTAPSSGPGWTEIRNSTGYYTLRLTPPRPVLAVTCSAQSSVGNFVANSAVTGYGVIDFRVTAAGTGAVADANTDFVITTMA